MIHSPRKHEEEEGDGSNSSAGDSDSGSDWGSACHAVSGLQLLRRIAPVAVISALMAIFMMLEVHIYIPYLYSRVSCCNGVDGLLEDRFDVTNPDLVEEMRKQAEAEGLGLHVSDDGRVAACDVPPFSKSSRLWSFSAHCTNKAYVQQTAQGLMAIIKPSQKLFGFAILPIGGALADSWGRRPVLALYAGGLILACALSAFDAHVAGSWGNGIVYLAGCLFGFSFQPKDSIISAAIADILGDDSTHKSRTFIALRTMDSGLAMVVNSVVYMYLKGHHDSHFYGWCTFGCVALLVLLVIVFGLGETLPKGFRRSPDPKVFIPFYAQCTSFWMVVKDVVLVLQGVLGFLFYIYFLGFLTTKTSYLTLIGFKMEDAILPDILASASVFVGAAVLLPLVHHLGVWNMSIVGNLLFALGYAFMGPFSVLVNPIGAYVATIILHNAVLVCFPAFQTIVSHRAGPGNQSQCQSAIAAIGTLGAVIGIPLYNKVLFDSTSHGWRQALCPIVSLCLALACVGLALIIRHLGQAADEAKSRAEESTEALVRSRSPSLAAATVTGEPL